MFTCLYFVTLLWVGMAGAKFYRDVDNAQNQTVNETEIHPDMKLFLHAFELMTDANHHLTAKMLTEAATHHSSSFVISASSAFHPLSLFALAAEGETRRELLDALKFHDENDPDNDDNLIRAANSVANGLLIIAKGIEVKTGNRIYISNYIQVDGHFLDLDSHGLGTEVVLFDSANGAQTVAAVNSWVANQTNNKIAKFLEPNDIDINTQAIVVDALYFTGQWLQPFDSQKSYFESFYATDMNEPETESTVVSELKFMTQTNTFGFNNAEDIDSQILELPYIDTRTNASFVIILPNSQTGLGKVLRQLSDPSILTNALNGINPQTVEVSIPQFKIETMTDLKEILQKVGVVSLFGSNAELPHLLKDTITSVRYKESNDIKKISPDTNMMFDMNKNRYARSSHLSVSKAVQKAYISVYEGGTEGAVANPTEAVLPALDPKTFKANHAFVFLIKHRDIVLFSGVFNPFNKSRRFTFDVL